MLDGEDGLTPYYMPLELFGKEEVAKQIALTLSYNLPVYAQSGIAGGIDVYEDEEGKEHLGKISGGAWFTILGYQRDDVRGATTIRLLYEGNECYADLSQLFENDFMGAVVGLR